MALLVPLLLVGLAVLLMAGSHLLAQRRQRHQAAAAAVAPPPRILIHSINDDRCTGCDACVAVCPTDVLELQSNKSRVLRFGDCIQCEQCMFACPTQALVMHWEDEEPPPLKVPNLDPFYQTAVRGMYLIGEVAGKPLVKNAANVGRAVVEHMLREGLRPGGGRASRKRAEGSDPANVTIVDVAIVGSGPGGLSAALTCIQRGLSYVVLEKEQLVASTIARYPKGKDVMAEPYDVRNVSFLPVYDMTKEQIVPMFQDLCQKLDVDIRLGEAVESVQRDDRGVFAVRTTVAAYRAQRVVLATGTRGKPRTLGVPGENLPKIASLLDDPDLCRDQDALVVGGGDSAVEAAIALADSGARVTLSYRGAKFNRAQAKNKQKIEQYAEAGRVKVYLGSQVLEFTADKVMLKLADGRQKRLDNRATFVLIGADPPVAWLEKLGVTYVERPHWYALGVSDQLVESLIGRQPESPRDIASLVRLVRSAAPEPRSATELPPVPEASVIAPLPRKWPLERPMTMPGNLDWGEAESVFTSARHPSLNGEIDVPAKGATPPPPAPSRAAPMSLDDFARASKGRRPSKKPKEHPAEVTRLLRSLRDDGARLAHDETSISAVSADPDSSAAFINSDDLIADESELEIRSSSMLSVDSASSVSVANHASDPGMIAPTRAIIEGLPPPGARPAPGRSPTPGRGNVVPRAKFIEARTTAVDPRLLEELRVEASPARPERADATGQVEIDVIDDEEDDDAGWRADEATAMAAPALLDELRDKTRRK